MDFAPFERFLSHLPAHERVAVLPIFALTMSELVSPERLPISIRRYIEGFLSSLGVDASTPRATIARRIARWQTRHPVSPPTRSALEGLLRSRSVQRPADTFSAAP